MSAYISLGFVNFFFFSQLASSGEKMMKKKKKISKLIPIIDLRQWPAELRWKNSNFEAKHQQHFICIYVEYSYTANVYHLASAFRARLSALHDYRERKCVGASRARGDFRFAVIFPFTTLLCVREREIKVSAETFRSLYEWMWIVIIVDHVAPVHQYKNVFYDSLGNEIDEVN